MSYQSTRHVKLQSGQHLILSIVPKEKDSLRDYEERWVRDKIRELIRLLSDCKISPAAIIESKKQREFRMARHFLRREKKEMMEKYWRNHLKELNSKGITEEVRMKQKIEEAKKEIQEWEKEKI